MTFGRVRQVMTLTLPEYAVVRRQGSLLLPFTITWAIFCCSALAQSKINPDANPWVLNYTAQGERTPKTIFAS
jgi:hypothetical protein